MKIKSKSILSIILALNLIFPVGYINNINSYATLTNKSNAIDAWETKAPMPTSRSRLTSSVVDGKVYVIGGASGAHLNTVEVYDPITDTWETKASMPTSRSRLTSSVVDGKVYVIGGTNGAYLNTVEVYDPITDTWETKAPMPTSRSDLTSSVVDNKIYCIGGRNTSYLNTVEVYDPATDTWETKSPISISRTGLASLTINNKIYCIGGSDSSTHFNTVEVYNPVTDTWETKSPMPTKRDIFGISLLDNKVYCIGGCNSSSINKVEVYDPATDTWETKASMPTSREGLTSTVANGKIYCIGGYNRSSYLNTVEIYIPNIDAPEYKAEKAVITAENNREATDIENARDLVNQLPEGDLKRELQDRLDAVNPELELERKTVSGNVDIYIKCENMLLMSLDTNSVTFEDFSGVEDMEKTNAVNISINSSLPYQLNAYLPIEIQNADKSNTMDKRILNIKENSETIYQAFNNTTDKIVLKDNCPAGNDLMHGIDIKLKGGIAHEKDVYKTTIKFEAEQK